MFKHILSKIYNFFIKSNTDNKKYKDLYNMLLVINLDPTQLYRLNFYVETPYITIIDYNNAINRINATEWDKHYIDSSLLVNSTLRKTLIKNWYVSPDNRMLEYDDFYKFTSAVFNLLALYQKHIKDPNLVPAYSNARKMELHLDILEELLKTIKDKYNENIKTQNLV